MSLDSLVQVIITTTVITAVIPVMYLSFIIIFEQRIATTMATATATTTATVTVTVTIIASYFGVALI